MTTPAGAVPANSDRKPDKNPEIEQAGSSGRSMSVEELIRYAQRLLAQWGSGLSPSRVNRLCRDYRRMAAGRIPFELYLLNNVDLPSAQRARVLGELDRQMREVHGGRKPRRRPCPIGEPSWRTAS